MLLALTALALTGAPARAVDARETVVLSPQHVTVDGAAVDVEAYNINGYNYFKLRDLAWLLRDTAARFDVRWDASAGAVRIATRHSYTAPDGSELAARGDRSATAVPSPQTVYINGGARGDLAAYNIGGCNFFRLRDLGSALGFGVSYNESANTAAVTPPAAVTPVAFRDFLFLGDSLISNPHWNANLWGKHGHKAFAGGGAVIPQFFGCTQYQVFVGGTGMGMQGTLKGRSCSGIVVLLGANDLGRLDPGTCEVNYLKLINELRGAFDASVPIFVLAVFPVGMDFQYLGLGLTELRNEHTQTLNTVLANDLMTLDGVWFADATGAFTDDDGMLVTRSGDGLHIAPADYERFYDAIAEALYATGAVVPAD